ncbi:MAG: manganese efflux pump MntP family protein [Beijerinckiaceae bacterium]|nr:manganese efflux pump MntP family protein [Beijerinckiaceae bacterium]
MLMVQTFVIAFSLSADAFAASLAKGARFPGMPLNRSLLIALGFGILEALAPLIGYLLGQQFSGVIEDYDHWVSFLLLGFLGVRMIWKSFSPIEDESGAISPTWGVVAATAIGTSVDATIVGVTLALVSDNIPLTIVTIGIVTFGMTYVGLRIGGAVGQKAGQWAEFAGGIGLAAIGTSILISHLSA